MANVNLPEYKLKARLDVFKLQIASLDEILNEYQDSETQRQGVQRLRHKLEEEYIILFKTMIMIEIDKDFQAEWESVDKLYANVIAKTKELLAKYQPGTAQPSSSKAVIEIPVFNGYSEDWAEFKKAFNNQVSAEPNLNDYEKFKLLKKHVSRRLEFVIELFEEKENKFEALWNQLMLAYEQTRYFVLGHAKSLFDTPAMSDDSSDSISELMNYMQPHIEWLRAILRRRADTMGFLLASIAISKMDSKTREAWERYLTDNKIPDNQIPDIDHIFKYLKGRDQTSQSNNAPVTKRTWESLTNSRRSPSLSCPQKKQCKNTSETSRRCHFCSEEGHMAFQCKKLLRMSVSERTRAVKKEELCENCFGLCHPTEQCRSNKNCRNCNEKHNTILCPRYSNKE